jgi:hypothetical protein
MGLRANRTTLLSPTRRWWLLKQQGWVSSFWRSESAGGPGSCDLLLEVLTIKWLASPHMKVHILQVWLEFWKLEASSRKPVTSVGR